MCFKTSTREEESREEIEGVGGGKIKVERFSERTVEEEEDRQREDFFLRRGERKEEERGEEGKLRGAGRGERIK